MSAPDPEGMSLLAKVVGAAAAVLTPPVLFWKWLSGQLDKKADKHAVANALQETKAETAVHRSYFKDVFEKLEAHQRRDEELFRQLMTTIANNHSELLRELGRKVDR